MKQNRKINVAPRRQGLYDPDNERDACGVGLVVNIKGNKTHDIVENGLQVLEHMMHRGAEGADNKTGDGAGILVQIPHEFILLQGIPVPEKGHYGTGLVFLPRDKAGQTAALGIVKRNVQAEGLNLMHVRDVPVNDDVLGRAARDTEPVIKQIFVTGDPGASTLERKLYIVRKKIEKEWLESDLEQKEACYVVSLSTRTLVYKGMLSSVQLRYYFPDLVNPYFTSGLALVHSRFSTNTFPTWSLAQPFRLLGHNGEINTIRGNRSWIESREGVLHPDLLCPLEELGPVVQRGMSDSASLDNAAGIFRFRKRKIPAALSNEALSLIPRCTTGPSSSSGQSRSGCSTPSRLSIQLRLPRIVLISPLCPNRRNGCARLQVGNVLVEKRECTKARPLVKYGLTRSGK